MRILIFNWKDLTHPNAGGAEKVTHQFAKYLVKFGHYVTLFTSNSGGCPSREIRDGILIIRRGTLWTVNIWAFWSYITYLKINTDIVIDQIHGIPFFTPLYVKKPILAWIHEVAGEIWFKEFPFAVAVMGMYFEKFYFKIYTHIKFITHTISTKTDLNLTGIPLKQIVVLPHTLEQKRRKKLPKYNRPTLIYIGRITPMKRIELLLGAIQLLHSKFPRLKLIIAGSGKTSYLKYLKFLSDRFRISKYIVFKSRVSENIKYQLFSSSWIHVHPSIKEGFGLTVLEAAISGTPTICFEVGGLKDVVKNGKTGIILPKQSSTTLANAISNLFTFPKLLKELSKNAYYWSRSLPTWENQARQLEKLLTDILE